jgi:cell division septal protein FtsQ
VTARSGALRRRRKPSLAVRLRVGWVFILLILGAASYAGYVLATLPALRVHAIDVRLDGSAVSEPEVLRAAAIDRSRNVWLLDTASIERRIEAIPYVDRATIRRIPPARLVIDVTEREPAACVRRSARSVTVDERRRVLQTGCARPGAIVVALQAGALGLPGSILEAPELPALLGDARALRAAEIDVRSVAADRFGQLIATQSNGVVLLFGSDADIAQKAKLVAPVLAAARGGRTIRAIDLRAPATPTVEYK